MEPGDGAWIPALGSRHGNYPEFKILVFFLFFAWGKGWFASWNVVHCLRQFRLQLWGGDMGKRPAPDGSVIELRRDFCVGIVTAFARIEGRAVGLMAIGPKWLGKAGLSLNGDPPDLLVRRFRGSSVHAATSSL
ncbi:hypothetical protein [Hyphomonas sp.]|uniref:hypothetical protein n=1 Tax=Hyphomonas sp. TaxID=87 RepID=UPI0025BA6CE6|nr:hypothetical protein [Hyphomonas sp.]